MEKFIFHGTPDERLMRKKQRLWNVILRTRSKTNLWCIQMEISRAVKPEAKRIQHWTWTFFPMFSRLHQFLRSLSVFVFRFPQQRKIRFAQKMKNRIFHQKMSIFIEFSFILLDKSFEVVEGWNNFRIRFPKFFTNKRTFHNHFQTIFRD